MKRAISLRAGPCHSSLTQGKQMTLSKLLLGTAIALSMISPALATRPQPVIDAYHDAIGNKPYDDTVQSVIKQAAKLTKKLDALEWRLIDLGCYKADPDKWTCEKPKEVQ
jgi:hypothetical protein